MPVYHLALGLMLRKSAAHLEKRRARLSMLEARVKQQINAPDYLMATLRYYCRENRDAEPCVANDPAWTEQLGRQREDLAALLLAIREKI